MLFSPLIVLLIFFLGCRGSICVTLSVMLQISVLEFILSLNDGNEKNLTQYFYIKHGFPVTY